MGWGQNCTTGRTHWYFWSWDPPVACTDGTEAFEFSGRAIGHRGCQDLGERWHVFVGKALLISVVIFGYVNYKIFSFFLEVRFGESCLFPCFWICCSGPLEVVDRSLGDRMLLHQQTLGHLNVRKPRPQASSLFFLTPGMPFVLLICRRD